MLMMAVAAALYSYEDERELARQAKESLLHYGTRWFPEFIIQASGQSVTTASGHTMLDWTSGQMSCLVGHGNPEIVQTINDHAANLDHLFSGMLSPPVIKLASRLTSLTPPGLDKAFFLSTGGESNEAAIRLAKMYTGKFEIVGLASSWHGMTGNAIGAQYHAGKQRHRALQRNQC
jgi:4-aminobutyrate aminotransferase-like enzyme